MSALSREGRYSSAVCASAGNLGQALAYSGSRRGIPVTVFAAATASPLKIDRMRALGATVHLEGGDIETPLSSPPACRERGQLPRGGQPRSRDVRGRRNDRARARHAAVRFDAVLLTLGGGAPASGVGHVIRECCPDVQVVAVQPVGAPAIALSWRNGAVVTTDTIDTIADGVAGRFPIPEILDDLLEIVDDVVLVDENSIKDGMRHLFDLGGLVVEPRRRSGWPRSSRTAGVSTGSPSPPSCVGATSRPTTLDAGPSTPVSDSARRTSRDRR